MKFLNCLTLMLTASFLALAGPNSTGKPVAGSMERIKVHGPSLEGNLEGDPAERDVFVYLPPSYTVNRSQRFPTANGRRGCPTAEPAALLSTDAWRLAFVDPSASHGVSIALAERSRRSAPHALIASMPERSWTS